jgi:VCBS repeat-containing protein
MCSFTNSSANVQDHQMVLTTSETTAFDVVVRNNDNSFSVTVTGLSASSPKKISLNSPGTGLNSQGVIGTSQLNNILDTEGLIVSGPRKFFVSIQQKSSAQGDLLTSKGTTGLGTDFYSGHMYSSAGGFDSHNGHFIGVMATENNTNVTFSNPNVRFSGKSNNNFTVSLNKGQSVVIGVSVNQIKSQQGSTKDLNVVNGTHITSNKPIAVSSGSWCASGYAHSSPGRDIGFDQLVPTDVAGDEYIIIKGEGKSGGAQHNERALVVATEPNTTVTYKNNSKTRTLTNAGDYFFTNINDFSNTTDGNLYIQADKKVFVYQTLSGANKKQTAGLCFIPPLKCTADKEVTIAFANKLSNLTVNPILKLVSQSGSTIKINGNTINGYNKSVPGNPHWESFNIPKSVLQNNRDNGQWNFKIESSGALNAMLAVQSGNVGGGGFYSGFGDIPQVNQSPDIAEQGLCGDNVILTASGFTSYNWYKNGIVITGENNSTYQPNNPGRYKVTGLSPCGSSTTESFPSSEIRILPCLSVSNASFTVTEGTDLNATFRIELSHAWQASDNVDVTFDYNTSSGSAISGQDFTPITGSGTIPSGASYVEISVPITNDILDEDDEDFTLTITNVVEAIESINVGTCTIRDDTDAQPNMTVSDLSFDENAGSITIPVNLNIASGKVISANYTITDNTATRPADYSATSYTGSLSFSIGETSKSISINIVDDNIFEPGLDEFFVISLSGISNASSSSPLGNISIVDNDAMPAISIANQSSEEGQDIVFQATLDRSASVDITFDYAITLSNGPGNAKQQDFTNYSSFSSGTINIPAGQTSFNFPAFTTNDDNANEQAENFVVNFSSVSNASLGNSSATGTILDNEGNPTLSISGGSATEGNGVTFVISVSPIRSTDINFEYQTVNGTASSPADFNGNSWTSQTLPANQSNTSITINTVQDTDEEGNENFTVEIRESEPKVDIAAGLDVATGIILDDDEAPAARDDNFSVNEDASLSDNVMTNDLGLGDPPVIVIANTNPSNGSLTINADGSFTYTPNAHYNGSDAFNYTIEDTDGDQSSARVNITVNQINDIPDAVADSYTIPEDSSLNDDVSSNDTGMFDLPITISLVSNVSNGSLSLNANGTFSYTPNSEYFGNDNFTYRVSDGNGDVDVATVTITVLFNNDAAPVAVDDNTSTNEDTAVSIDVLANDTDIDGNQTIDKATVLVKSGPSNGSLSQNHVTGEVTYTPDPNYTGSDSFTYTIKDNSGAESNQATVSINVTVDNDPPVAICKSGITIALDASGNYTLDPVEIDNGSNDDSDGGTVSLSVSPISFDCDDKGNVSVILTVTDEDLASTTCSTTITVVDNTVPTVKNSQGNIIVNADPGVCGAVVNYTGPVFTDNCDGDQSGTLTEGMSSGSTFPIGVTTVTYEYTDASGNGPVVSDFTVTVTDNQNPQLNNTANRVFAVNSSGCSYTISGTSYDLTASDNCGIQSLTHNYDGGGSSLNGKSFQVGTTDVLWTAEDIHGNVSKHTVQITVNSDLSVNLSGPTGNEACGEENVIFTTNASGGNPSYIYQFYINGVETTSGVSGNTLTVSNLNNGDRIKSVVTDSRGCNKESSELVITIHPKPSPKLYFN